MKRLLIILILLLMPVSGWGATYYVRLDGTNTSPYDTEAKGATVIKTVVDYIRTNGAGAGDTIDIGAGTFNNASDYFSLNNTNLDNLTIQGAGRTLTIIDTPSGTAVHPIYGDDNMGVLTVNDLTLIVEHASKYAVYKSANAGTWTFNDCDFRSGTVHADHLLRLYGDTTNFYRCRFVKNYSASGYPLYALGDSGGTIAFCQFYALGSSYASNVIPLYGTGTTNVYNSVILDSSTNGIACNNGTVNIKNCVIQGGVISHTSYCINKVGGTVNATNNLLISSPYVTEYWCNSLNTDSNNIKTNAEPKFYAYARGGYIVPHVDDTGGLTSGYVGDIAALLAAKGMTGTWYTNICNMPSENYADVRTLITDGTIEVALHGYSRTNLTYDHALNFSQAGGSNCTVAFDGSTITCNCDGTDYDQTLDTTNASYDTMGEIITALNGSKGWTVAKSTTDSQTASSINDGALATSMASQGATAEPCDIDFDRTGIESGLFKDEIADAKAILEGTIVNGAGNITDPQTGLTYACNSMGATYNDSDATAKAAVASVMQNYRYSIASTEESIQRLTDVDVYALGAVSFTDIKGDGSEADVRQNTRALAFSVIQNGLIAPILCHNTDELSIEQWGWFLDELSKIPQVTVTSMQLAIADIKANWTDDEDGTYSRTFGYIDPRLQATSPCINAGTNPFSDGDGDQYDYAGNLVWRDSDDKAVGAWSDGVEIGPYGWFGGVLLQ